MADTLEKQVEQLLLAGEGKKAVLARLGTPANRGRVIAVLNNKTLVARRHQSMWLNLILAGALLYVTLKRLLAISAAGHFDFYLLADFIVPTINFYILREILRFHRMGYQLLVLLTALGLVYEANRVMPDLFIHLAMIGIAIALHLRLFPKNDLLPHDKKA
ncbi:MAG: hypothetical protein ACYCYR_00675 [Desulfobulbaceae bacterium]